MAINTPDPNPVEACGADRPAIAGLIRARFGSGYEGYVICGIYHPLFVNRLPKQKAYSLARDRASKYP
ncbi:protein of unknown function [Candidatus Nitrotoga arctica]|uniref:Uncharacterized protein n=1 Tax=Candidatus Nitrotoga arctica TaxID=453162 RepID=A0ABM8YX23_9PROT|nr:protein of unknown function [Candidatus Nitrotoga arctica]